METFLSILIIVILLITSGLVGYGLAEANITQKLCNSDKKYDFCKIEKTTYKIEVK